MSDGIIKSESAFVQPLHFEGVQFNTANNAITPTDIDAVLEFRDKLFILIEVKKRGAEMGAGQRFAYERICKAIDANQGKTCVAFFCWHDVEKPKPVMLRDLYIKSFFWPGPSGYQWHESARERPVIKSINALLDLTGIGPEEVSRCEFSEVLDMANCPF